MSQQVLQKGPVIQPPQLDPLSEAIVDGIEAIASLFKKKKKESSVTTVSSAMATNTQTEKRVQIGNLSIPQTYATSVETFYNQTQMYRVDYKELYVNAPQTLVDSVVAFLPASAGDAPRDLTYEEILRAHIEVAKLANHSLVKTADMILWLCIGWGGIQRTSLCTNWACLLFNLFAKFTSTITPDERNRIARGGIALAIGSTITFFQYMHKSPYGVTNYLRIMYEGYNEIRDWSNQHFSYQIPDILKMESPRKEFARMTDDEKTTVGQMLNMVYTFRIGDAYLETCKSSNIWTDTTMEKIIDKSVSPLPEKEELKKMYKLYTKEKLYFL